MEPVNTTLIAQLIIAGVIAIISGVVTARVQNAEMKRDVENMKEKIKAIEVDGKNDISELKTMMKENNSDRKSTLDKMERHIEEIFTTLTDIKVKIAEQK